MALVAGEVRVGITGELFYAPKGTVTPGDATSALTEEWRGLGYVSEDGVTEGYDDSIDNIVAWQNATVVRAVRTSSVTTLQCTLIQSRGATLDVFHPGSIVEPNDDEWMIKVKPANADPRSWVLDVIDGSIHNRIYVGNGEVTERGDVTYATAEAIGYDITLTCYPDDEGLLLIKYSDDAAWGLS